jgi:hypothetical protein
VNIAPPSAHVGHPSRGLFVGRRSALGVCRMVEPIPVRAMLPPNFAGSVSSRHGSTITACSESGRSRGEVELELASCGWPRPRRRTSTEANSASTRAMSSGLLAIFTKRIAPRQRGQVMMSTANTRCRSHAHGCRVGCLVVTSSSVAAPPSDNGICVGSALLGSGPGTTSGRASARAENSPSLIRAWAASTP